MDEHEQKQTEGTPAPEAGGASSQSAQEDLKKVAERAKAATGGFTFGKLFEGRLDEKNYLYFAVLSLVVGFVVGIIPVIGFLIGLALLVVGVGATVRRLRDINMDPWFALILIVPYVDLLFVIYLCWKHGDAGSNKYGNAPDRSRDLFKAILNT